MPAPQGPKNTAQGKREARSLGFAFKKVKYLDMIRES
jgi:hypothetical protein